MNQEVRWRPALVVHVCTDERPVLAELPLGLIEADDRPRALSAVIRHRSRQVQELPLALIGVNMEDANRSRLPQTGNNETIKQCGYVPDRVR